MSLKTKPNKTSGSSPVFSYGDYTEMSNTPTQQDAINAGKTFKHSVMKSPFMSNQDYQSMEFELSPIVIQPVSSLVFPSSNRDKLQKPFLNDIEVVKHPCTCGGACTGDAATMKNLWNQVNKAIKDGIIKGKDGWELQLNIERFIRNTVFVGNEFSFHTAIAMDYQCQGTGIELADTTLSCGGKELYGNLNSSASGDYQKARLWVVIPFPSDFNCTTQENCACWYIDTYVDCGAGFVDCTTPRDIYMTTCTGVTRLEIKPPPGDCSALTIVNQDGSPATDTILKSGSLDFATTGNCCGTIVWSVSPTTGGTSISSSGVLTAGATSCGSLLVTASCPACGTSDTQYVRVTNAGSWYFINNEEYCSFDGYSLTYTCIADNIKRVYYYKQVVYNNLNPCPSVDDNNCPLLTSRDCFTYTPSCIYNPATQMCCPYLGGIKVYEWQC